jgi:hypothetical protein
MLRSIFCISLLASSLPCAVWCQRWEVGGSAGYGLYRDVRVSNGSASGQTGFSSGVAFGGVFANETSRHIGGEVRYTFRSDDLRVSSGSASARAGGQSHALHYDFLIHADAKESAVRPFAAIGAGVKIYRGTGVEPAFQPLSGLVVLTRTTETQPLISAGGGLKFRVSPRSLLRVDFRDYMTPFPSSLLAPRANTQASGWVHDFILMVGISATF